MNEASGIGPATLGSTVPQPSAPAIVDRVNGLENRMNEKDQQTSALDRAMTLLINEARATRAQFGLPPLPDDYFTS